MQRKVLFISGWYPNPKNKTHGIFVKRCAEAVALNEQVAVIHVHSDASYTEDLKIESWTENNVFEVFVFVSKKAQNPFSKFSAYKKNYQAGLDFLLANWGKPDLLQINVLFPAGIAGMEIADQLKIPFVICEHWTGYQPEDGSYRGFIKKFFTRATVKKASRLITVSEHLRYAMESHGLTGSYTIIPNAVNTNVFKSAPRLSASSFRFLHVSSLDTRQKNVQGIISVFTKLISEFPAIELHIIGEGDNRSTLEQLCGGLLNKAVFFKGQQFDASLADEFNSANCLVLFSNYENLPVVILEALCCGTPVISSHAGGIKEILNKEQGTLVAPGDEEQLYSAMKKMIADSSGYNRQQIAKYGAEHFSFFVIGNAFSKVYSDILSK